MKKTALLLLSHLACIMVLYGQDIKVNDKLQKEITTLIDQYSQAREKRDTGLLKYS